MVLTCCKKRLPPWWAWRNGSIEHLESGAFHRAFTPELADKLAALYGIPVEDILDDYTLFLHRGGGDFLRYRVAKAGTVRACRPCKGQQDKHPLLGKRAKDHQSEVL